MATRAILSSHYYDEVCSAEFMREMCGRSDFSLRLAHEIPPQTTYPVIWLAHENLQLMSIIEGDASLGVWRRVSDLATDLFALGLNREATYSPELIPLFLAECRRKIFARDYYLDKYSQWSSIAPPRISSRQTDCKLPLDIPHDAPLTTSLETLSEIQHNLSHNDWDADGIISTVTWARLRCILGEFRVEIAEYQIRSTPAVDADKLRLLKVSATMLEIFRTSGKFVESSDQVPPRSTRAYSNLWAPSAIILTTALETNIHDPTQLLPSGIKPTFLIRNISVLVSQLESVCSPDVTNYEFCVQASKAIARNLDSILDSSTPLALGSKTLSCPERVPGSATNTSQSEGFDSGSDAIEFFRAV